MHSISPNINSPFISNAATYDYSAAARAIVKKNRVTVIRCDRGRKSCTITTSNTLLTPDCATSPDVHTQDTIKDYTLTVTVPNQCKSEQTDSVRTHTSEIESENIQKYSKRMSTSTLSLLDNQFSLDSLDIESDEYFFERQCLEEHGYVRVRDICDSLQGQLFEARSLKTGKTVVIKKTDKQLYNDHISVQDGMNILVEENIIKEAIILHYLTVTNKPTNNHIAQFIKFFETDHWLFLVMEKAGNDNLCEFNRKAHQYIAEKKLKLKDWKKIVKYIFWQLSVAMHWLHHDMGCCHLDLNLSNIGLLNGNFIENKQTGTVSVDPNIKVKLLDFGLSEVFKPQKYNTFACSKNGITDDMHLSAPRVFCDELYDARKADIWSMGIILYQLSTGLEPYKKQCVTDSEFYRIKHGKVFQLVKEQSKTKNVNQKMIDLMCKLLAYRQSDRISSKGILTHEWLKIYNIKYRCAIAKKSQLQSLKNSKSRQKMESFPYYTCRELIEL